MSGPIKLEVNHVEMLADEGMEWSMSTEEVLGGTGRATLSVQDRTNSWEPQAHWDVKVSIRTGGWVLFRGEIINEPVELETGHPWRTWKLDCADINGETPQRLVGAFDGKTWQDVDGLGDYVNIDPNAHSLKTDKLTVQALFDAYMRYDGEAIGTTMYVGEYLSDFPMLSWSYTTLQGALEELAAEIAENIQFWIDPDLRFHWIAIPAWQDLLQDITLLGGDPESDESLLAGMMPEGAPQELAIAPYFLSDVRDDYDEFQVSFESLKFTFDGSSMPEQIYVRGATGYVYNAPAVNPTGETVTINPEGYGSSTSEVFKLTFLSSTKIWQKNSSGLISSTFDTASAGGPYDVKFMRVPVNPANGKGGHFWQLITGPNVGWLVDNDTNYFGYGSIRVQKVVVEVTEATVGVGGTGWVNEVTQDKNKRQAYLEAGVSTSREKRDALGGQALYRASFPTLRGSLRVNGKETASGRESRDGWRVGQLVQISDARLPTALDGRYFMIQRVRTTLLEGTEIRVYDIDWGDGPTSRYTMQPPKGGGEVTWPNPVTEVVIEARDLAPGPNATQVIIGQLMSKSGEPWKIAGKVVKWSLEVYNSGGTQVTGQGELDPEVSATDANGRARTTLTTGTQTGLVYFVFADVPVDD
jgi:hypothetical protein